MSKVMEIKGLNGHIVFKTRNEFTFTDHYLILDKVNYLVVINSRWDEISMVISRLFMDKRVKYMGLYGEGKRPKWEIGNIEYMVYDVRGLYKDLGIDNTGYADFEESLKKQGLEKYYMI